MKASMENSAEIEIQLVVQGPAVRPCPQWPLGEHRDDPGLHNRVRLLLEHDLGKESMNMS